MEAQAAIGRNCPVEPWSSKKTTTGFCEFCACIYLYVYRFMLHTGHLELKSGDQKLLTFRSSNSCHLARTTKTAETTETTNDFIVMISDLFRFLLCCFPIATFGTSTPARPMSSTSKPSKSNTVPQICTESSSSLTSQGQDHPVLSVTTFFKALNMRVSKKTSLSLAIWDLFFQFALIFWAQWLEDPDPDRGRLPSYWPLADEIIRKRPTIGCCAKRSKHLEKKKQQRRGTSTKSAWNP